MIKFNKELNIGHVLTAVVLLAGLAGFTYAMRSDIDEVKLRQDFSTEVTAALNRESLAMIRELRQTDEESDDRFDEIEKKIAVLEATSR